MSKVEIFLTIFIVTLSADASVCSDWFSAKKIQKGDGCEMACSIAPVDMSSFACHNECSKLCKSGDDISYSLLKMYGLTEDEINICDKSPIDCITGYKDSLLSEHLCEQIYFKSRTNDESDACRHFAWSMYMSNSLGTDRALAILNAHENNPREPSEERSMDLANNRLGILTYQKMIAEKRDINSESISEAFKRNLKQNNFIVISPKYKNSGGLP